MTVMEARPVDDAAKQATADDSRVDAVRARLDQLADLPVESHPAVFEDADAKLREMLMNEAAEPDDPAPA